MSVQLDLLRHGVTERGGGLRGTVSITRGDRRDREGRIRSEEGCVKDSTRESEADDSRS